MVAQNGKTAKAEKARRKAQSNRDKKSASKVARIPRQPKAPANRGRRTKGGSNSAYAKLVLDPCHGEFTQSNLPGSAGGQQIRCPYRLIVTVPSATTTITGNSQSNGSVCNTLFASLTPHAMVPGVGPAAITVIGANTEQQVFTVPPAANYITSIDPPGLSSMAAMAGEMRPIAACIRISCLGQDTANSGLFYGYEGANRQILAHVTDDTGSYYPQCSVQQLILTGAITNTNTYGVLESKINYPNADAAWQEFRQVTGTQSAATGVTRSGDASDPDWSEMPIAIAGVTSATPGTQYLIDGAIVYEWQPKITLGLDTPAKKPSNPTALGSTARALSAVAKDMGGMLVTMAANYVTGGSASAANHILRLGYNQYAASHAKQPLIGW